MQSSSQGHSGLKHIQRRPRHPNREALVEIVEGKRIDTRQSKVLSLFGTMGLLVVQGIREERDRRQEVGSATSWFETLLVYHATRA